jgi:hypothetical protein
LLFFVNSSGGGRKVKTIQLNKDLLKLPNEKSSQTSLASLNAPNRTRSAIEIARFSFIMKNQHQKQYYNYNNNNGSSSSGGRNQQRQQPNNSSNLLLTSSSLNKYPSNEAWLISNYSPSATQSRPVNRLSFLHAYT